MGQELAFHLESISGNFSKTRKDIINGVDVKKYPLNTEPALVHPENSSTVKIRENGTIDVFVGTDNGIRIDPSQRTISVLANTYREKTHSHTESITRDKASDVGGNWKVNVKGNVDVTAGGKMNFAAGKGVHIEGRTMQQWLDTIPRT